MKVSIFALILTALFSIKLFANENNSSFTRTRHHLKIIQSMGSESKSGDLFRWSEAARIKNHSEAKLIAKMKAINAIVDQCNHLDGNLMYNTIQTTEINPEPAKVIMVVSMICEY